MKFEIKTADNRDIKEVFADAGHVENIDRNLAHLGTDFENHKENILNDLEELSSQIKDIQETLHNVELGLIKVQQDRITKDTNFFKNAISSLVKFNKDLPKVQEQKKKIVHTKVVI